MMTFRNKFVIGCAVVAILLGAGVAYRHLKEPMIAKVGEVKITPTDIKYRDQLIRLAYPSEKRSMGLSQLMKSAVNYEILKNHGVPFTEQVIDQEERRIDRDTKDPEALKKIKAIFGENKQAYRRIYVLPTLVDRVIYFDFFLNDESIQNASMEKASALIAKAQGSEKSFQKLAAEQGLHVKKLTVSLKSGLDWHLPRDSDVAPAALKADGPGVQPSTLNEEAQRWHDLFIEKSKVGDVVSSPMSYGNDLLVARYVKKNSPSVFELEVAIVPKRAFGPWYEAEKAKIATEVYEPSYLPPQ